MLSKKMAFSLTSLITIFALAFVAPSAMAGEFDVTLDATEDVSAAADFQMNRPATSLVVTILSGQAIALPAASVFVTTYDEDGDVLGFPTAVVAPVSPLANEELTLTIPVTADVAKVNIKIAKGIASADPINADTSKALDATIVLVDADDAGLPTVYSIRRVDNPLLPVTAATVQVIVTLSEMPKEFKKGNLSISDNATIADPVALDPVDEDPARLRVLSSAIGRSSDDDLPVLRGLYGDIDRDGATVTDTTDYMNINEYLAVAANTPMALTEALDAYNALTTVDIQIGTLLGGANEPSAHQIGVHPPMTTYSLNNEGTTATITSAPTGDDAPAGWHPIDDEEAIQEAIDSVDVGALMRNVNPTRPTAADGPEAQVLYQTLQNVYKLYMAEMALHSAYMAAVEAEMDSDDDALADYFAVELGELVPDATGRDDMLHPYVVTITPKYPAGKGNIVLKVGVWEDTTLPLANKYDPASMRNEGDYDSDGYMEGRNQLTLKVGKETLTALTSGTRLNLPHGEGAMIPASGFYLLTKNKDGSGINYSHEKDDENLAHKQTLEQLKFNVRAGGLPNLETFLANGGTIHLVAYDGTAAASAYISEVMWGSDASQDDSSNSQWIEIANATTSAIAIPENKWALWFYQANATPATSYTDTDGTTAGTIVDMIGTESATGFWSVAGKGQGGRTNVDPGGADVVAIAPTQPLISMSRVMDAVAGGPADGTMPTSWMASTPPSVNFKLGIEGTRVASPGADRIITPSETASDAAALKKIADAAAAAQKKIDSTGTIPQLGSIYISEIMFAGGGVLPQWIEISNGSRSEEINLSGWTITVDNAAADADVDVGATATFTIPDGTKIAPSEQHDPSGDNTPSTILVVTERGRNNLTGAKASGQVINLSEDNEVELILAGVVTGKYMLLSEMAFMITLAPPEPAATKAPAGETVTAKSTRTAAEKKAKAERKDATDMAGNLGADGAAAWVLPMGEAGRSSIIRGHIQVTRGPAAPEMGNMMDSWVLASDTSFAQVTHIRASSYYGAASDVGTPGFRAGGALPVELSHFSPARDKVTGAVVITWSTQSELNNAGFFIKRSQQRDGEFKVINATMIAGAGTTSEKQSYTYSDTTAQPNVVYYYQIEDVSLDGNRQTLTRGIRLKGHVGAAGKATVLWGDLKTLQ